VNIRTVYRHELDGTLDKFLSQISKDEIKQLIFQFKIERENHVHAVRNYSKGRHDRFAKPYLDRIDRLMVVMGKVVR